MTGLPEGAFLQNGKYRIDKKLDNGGFGITYLGTQVGLERHVAIKEFFMKDFCIRDKQTSIVSIPNDDYREFADRFRSKFIKEARTIAKLNHQHIIRVHDIFEENGTAYYVMEFHSGGSLADLVEKRGRLSEDVALRYIRQVADALRYIHDHQLTHLDVKPANVLLDENQNAVLIDFGLTKHYDQTGAQTTTSPVGMSHGYAPLEQYSMGGVGLFSPATDIYALGATLYKLLTGEVPPEANEVNEDGLPPFPGYVSKQTAHAITEAMNPNRKKRPQTIDDFLALLGDGEHRLQKHIDLAGGVRGCATHITDDGGRQLIVNGVSFKMVLVDGGEFVMGGTAEQACPDPDEMPQHKVKLSAFFMSETLVTQALYKAVMGVNPSHFNTNPQHPVESVTWHDCQRFIQTLNQITGFKFRLPTEAEWEYAARGGQQSHGCQFAGSAEVDSVAWYEKNSEMTTHPVMTKQPNELGIYDLSGNVWEWCADWKGEYFPEKQTNPRGVEDGRERVSRGGAWFSSERTCRVSNRNSNVPGHRSMMLGFRIVLE